MENGRGREPSFEVSHLRNRSKAWEYAASVVARTLERISELKVGGAWGEWVRKTCCAQGWLDLNQAGFKSDLNPGLNPGKNQKNRNFYID